jgi:hypothetical protein
VRFQRLSLLYAIGLALVGMSASTVMFVFGNTTWNGQPRPESVRETAWTMAAVNLAVMLFGALVIRMHYDRQYRQNAHSPTVIGIQARSTIGLTFLLLALVMFASLTTVTVTRETRVLETIASCDANPFCSVRLTPQERSAIEVRHSLNSVLMWISWGAGPAFGLAWLISRIEDVEAKPSPKPAQNEVVTPEDVLRLRLARGEITSDEFEQIYAAMELSRVTSRAAR